MSTNKRVLCKDAQNSWYLIPQFQLKEFNEWNKWLFSEDEGGWNGRDFDDNFIGSPESLVIERLEGE